ncbi:unnamed protein product, partial [Ectocarpus sp. 13 AM-2016]
RGLLRQRASPHLPPSCQETRKEWPPRRRTRRVLVARARAPAARRRRRRWRQGCQAQHVVNGGRDSLRRRRRRRRQGRQAQHVVDGSRGTPGNLQDLRTRMWGPVMTARFPRAGNQQTRIVVATMGAS